jgi:hypothetical protein
LPSNSSPSTVAPGARELKIDALSPNGRDNTITNDFDSAFAAKEIELCSLLSPSASVSPASQAFVSPEQISSFPGDQFPEFIDSFASFSAMKVVFLNFLVKNELSHLIPESKLYRSVYFPYGYLPQASPIDLLSEQIWCN